MRFDRNTSLLAGIDDSVLRARLAQMQQDYLDLVSGRKTISGAYAQGDGSKSVSYDRTTLDKLILAIRQLQAQLGLIDNPRRAIGVRF